MIFIIGLGNPEEKYKNTRHNLGFRIVDEFRKKNNFLEFKLSKKFNALLSENIFDGKKIIIAKPQTFMNKSGKSVKSLTNFYKTTRTVLVVVHDDIDLPLGKIRIVKNRGAAGHKGIESIIREIGTKDFIRFRIGISPSQVLRSKIWEGKPKKEKPADSFAVRRARQNTKFSAGFVLQKFKEDEEKIIKEIVKKTVEAIELSLKKGLEKAMNKYNR